MKKKINISIVGTGLMGLQHIKAISKSKKAKLHSIVDISKNAASLSKKFKIPLYSSVAEVLKSKNLDAVIVATPNQLHEKHTVSFLKMSLEQFQRERRYTSSKITQGRCIFQNN